LIRIQPNDYDRDGDNISDAVEDENGGGTVTGERNIIHYGENLYDYIKTSSNDPPLIGDDISNTSYWYSNRGTHDYSLASDIPKTPSDYPDKEKGQLINGLLIAPSSTGYAREPMSQNCDEQNNHNSDNWGTLGLINLIEKVGRAWNKKYQSYSEVAQNYPNITVKDLSRAGGCYFATIGTCTGHSNHQTGVEVDIRLVHDDQSTNGGLNYWDDPDYSSTRTQQLVDVFRSLGDIYKIYFNDPSISGVEYHDGHNDHLHIWISDPDGINN